ncbi:MAG: ATP--guanido phosphotransferase [Actinobacteria bacterium]|nr:ATP--guanido phosphotransferase [Actinomycetota bacterium]MBU1942126.1 ATP--guanido phosphotransferase [Actinomycetota bacterium]MBU2686690.1 ATP--guanido phosphotransferase [Actinomycetota bacterium]
MAARSPVPTAGDWLGSKGPGYPLVLSSRARLARNLEGLPFPGASDEEELERARGMVLESVSRGVAEERDWEILFAEELRRDELGIMAEEHLTGPSFCEEPAAKAMALGPGKAAGVLVNDEDHVRIRVMMPGAQFMKAWSEADTIDNRLEREVRYSFDHQLGYLTACPSNVGTGLRLSAMMHLPALVVTGDIGKTIAALGQAGMYVRGLYGEGSGVAGNLFQVSNRRTLGRSEEEIVTEMDTVVAQVAGNEKTARKVLTRGPGLDLADRVYRALGILERARKLGFNECLELLSMVRLGVELEVLTLRDFNLLEVGAAVAPYHLGEALGVEAAGEDVDRERAVEVRRWLDL